MLHPQITGSVPSRAELEFRLTKKVSYLSCTD